MIALQVEDIREFTKQLFMAETFDRFLVQEARVVTFSAFSVDGRLHQDFFTDEELEQARLEDYATWQMIRPFCFSLIKGRSCRRASISSCGCRPRGLCGLWRSMRLRCSRMRMWGYTSMCAMRRSCCTA